MVGSLSMAVFVHVFAIIRGILVGGGSSSMGASRPAIAAAATIASHVCRRGSRHIIGVGGSGRRATVIGTIDYRGR